MTDCTEATLNISDPPADYPSEWVQDAVMKGGETIRIRPIAPSDRDALQAMVRGLSRESTYFRFFRVKEELEPEELDRFTQLNYHDAMAFIAIRDGRLVGVGRYNTTEGDPAIAEAAFAVADECQQKGIGTLLLYRLTAYARSQGIEGFRAHLLADNHVMMRVFRGSGYGVQRDLDEGVYTVSFPTEESEESTAVRDEREKRASAKSMLPLMAPQSVAVIGASRDVSTIGGRLFNNLINGDFTGPVYPVNPKSPVVRSVAAYPSVLDIPDNVDLAFIVVSSKHVIPSVEQCIEKGVRALVVISAGFSEVGGAGVELEAELLDLVRSHGLRMVGPNCMGLLNTDPAISLDGQFGPIRPPQGNVALSSQSGALGLAILDYAARHNIGISTFVSVGNLADVSGDDLLLYWEDDPATDVILLYMESFGNPRRFARFARRIARKKPIVAVKSGRTESGARAASSHTGSLASLDVAVDALFHQTGVIRVDTLEELFDVTSLLSNEPVPKGGRVGIVTNAGGPAILAVDALESRGLEVPVLSDGTQQKLRALLSPEAAVKNPVDMIAAAGATEYRGVLEAMLEADELDAVIAIFIPASPMGVAEIQSTIREVGEANETDKTFLAVFMQSGKVSDEAPKVRSSVPEFAFPERAARALHDAVRYGEWLERPEGEVPEFDDVDPARGRGALEAALVNMDDEGGWLDPDTVDALLESYGLSVPASGVVEDEEAAVSLATEIGGPVVLKVVSPSALHKSDVGGVVLDVEGEDAVRAAYRQVMGAVPDPEGVLIQEFVSGGHEILIGMVEDPNFGPLVVFGLGGVFVELIGDVAFRIHPLTDLDADEMIQSVKSARLLEGYRGEDPGDVEAVKEALLRVSALIEDVPEMVEMDMNPVKVGAPGEGVRVVDARIKIKPTGDTFDPSRVDFPTAL
ncbi:MAG: bifunctional GNAT family N-acetyltransferase/acetate--CoA ligase family protein [Actinomycetota bacterium]